MQEMFEGSIQFIFFKLYIVEMGLFQTVKESTSIPSEFSPGKELYLLFS